MDDHEERPQVADGLRLMKLFLQIERQEDRETAIKLVERLVETIGQRGEKMSDGGRY